MCTPLGNRSELFPEGSEQPTALEFENGSPATPELAQGEVLILGFTCPDCSDEHIVHVHPDKMLRYHAMLTSEGVTPVWYKSTEDALTAAFEKMVEQQLAAASFEAALIDALSGALGGQSRGIGGYGGAPGGIMVIGGGSGRSNDPLAGLFDLPDDRAVS